MWIQFLLEHAHFAIHLFVALVCFAVFWLYADAWQIKRELKETIKLAGFFLLSLSFLMEATIVETTIVPAMTLFGVSSIVLIQTVKIIGYLCVIAGNFIDPLQSVPGTVNAGFGGTVVFGGGLQFLLPVSAVYAGLLYLRRSTIGLEDHLKSLSYVFFLFSISELIGLTSLFRTTTDIRIYELVAPFGVFWILSEIFVLLGGIVLGRWVFGYLLKQFQPQLFMIYTTTILIIFLITTVSFTGLLLNNMESEARRQMETDVKVLDFALGSQRDQLISDAQLIAKDGAIRDALETSDRKALGNATTTLLESKHFSSIVIVSPQGVVLARGEDRDRVGDSLSGDPLIKRGLLGESKSTIVSKDGVIAPNLSIQTVSPIRNAAQTIIGAVVVGKSIDMAFVDGMKKTTGLDASVYGDMTVSATTFVTDDGISRGIGMKETHEQIRKTVLTKGEVFTGTVPMRGTEYTSAFLPLKDVDGNPVGMLFVGRPQSAILVAAGRSIQYTFIITAVLLVCSIIPAYVIATYISNQL